jgi:tRNA-splicing ligase RtcB (3'-phosphate/5'-hydroxy nucleic acid ligase)
MPVKKTLTDGAVPVKIYTDVVEDAALEQLRKMAQMPFIHSHIAVMPDVHLGKGATIGSVIPTSGAIIPAAVGVDLGCGMKAVRTDLTSHDLPEDLSEIRNLIEMAVPHGRTANGGPGDKGAWADAPRHVLLEWKQMLKKLQPVLDMHPNLVGPRTNTYNHLGTLGTGNHFIEICLDEQDRVWIMLHSGSRGVGNRIGSYFIEKAKEEMDSRGISVPDRDLSYLPTDSPHFADYCTALFWAQEYAATNRRFMMGATVAALSKGLGTRMMVTEEAVECHHNYVAEEFHFGKEVLVTRKGAINASAGQMGIIPGSMGTGSFIVRGLGNPESFCSCSHGAGRTMSRTAARKKFTVEDLAAQTAGVECRKDEGVLDEIPGAYKDINEVMENQNDLVEVVYKLRQIINVKG